MRGAHDAVAPKIIAHGDGHGVAVKAFVAFPKGLVIGAIDEPGRGVHVKEAVEHQLRLGPARAEDGVEAAGDILERPLRLEVHHPNGHQQTAP